MQFTELEKYKIDPRLDAPAGEAMVQLSGEK